MAVLLEDRRLGDEQEGRLAFGLFRALSGRKWTVATSSGNRVLVGVEDLDLDLDRPPRPVAHRDDLAEPAAVVPARHGADGDLGRLADATRESSFSAMSVSTSIIARFASVTTAERPIEVLMADGVITSPSSPCFSTTVPSNGA